MKTWPSYNALSIPATLLKTCCIVLFFLSSLSFGLQAQQNRSPTPEYKIKAAFLYNFTRFVSWPSDAFSSPEDPFVIGIVGDDPFGQYIDKLVKGEKVSNRPIQIKRFHQTKDISNCQILYFNLSDPSLIGEIISKTDSLYTLTVGEANGFIASGGLFSFYKEMNKVKIEINVEAIKKSQLEISSKLLSIARISAEKEL